MELSYKQQDEVMIPDLQLKGQIAAPLGKYGLMRKEYLEKNHGSRFHTMVLTGMLYPHCQQVEKSRKRKNR